MSWKLWVSGTVTSGCAVSLWSISARYMSGADITINKYVLNDSLHIYIMKLYGWSSLYKNVYTM